MSPPNFRNMTPEQFDAYIPMTDEIQAAHEEENKFREWCVENDEDPMDDDSRDIYNEIKQETGDNFWKELSEEDREGYEGDMNKD